jgi:hypothetical protein
MEGDAAYFSRRASDERLAAENSASAIALTPICKWPVVTTSLPPRFHHRHHAARG